MNDLNVVALSQGGGPIGEVARTFGVDWPHLIAQMISSLFSSAIFLK